MGATWVGSNLSHQKVPDLMNPCRLRAIERVEDAVKAEPAGTESQHDRFHAQITRHPELRTSSVCGNAEKKYGGFVGYFQLMSWRDSETYGILGLST